MPLSIQDALLLALVLAAMGVLVIGDLLSYLDSRRNQPPPRVVPRALPQPRQLGLPEITRVRSTAAYKSPVVADLLIVDDSAVARAKLRKLFSTAGYSLELAVDGVEALAFLSKGQYLMMITDLEMPNMNGIELIRACRQSASTAGMPIIAVSAHENLRATFNECSDVCGVHRKPWVDEILLSHVATQVGTRIAAKPAAGQRATSLAQ